MFKHLIHGNFPNIRLGSLSECRDRPKIDSLDSEVTCWVGYGTMELFGLLVFMRNPPLLRDRFRRVIAALGGLLGSVEDLSISKVENNGFKLMRRTLEG